MYRRNLDIFLAGALGLLGGAAYVVHVPSPVQVILGIALFFAPGYLWSAAILNQRLSGIERTLTSAGLALILPILGGFLFYWLRIPLFRSAWVGLLVVLTLLGVVAVAVARLREPAAEPEPEPRRGPPEERKPGRTVLHGLVFGAAAVIALGTVAFSVKSAQAQKYTTDTALSMTQVFSVSTPTAAPTASGISATVDPAASGNPTVTDNQTKANLVVTNYQGTHEEYLLKLLKNNKVIHTWDIQLNSGQTWQKTIAYSATNYTLLANLYMYPNITKVYRYTDNGVIATK